MENRENALLEIYERIKAHKDELGLISFKRTPTAPVREEDLPCVFMSEDVDTIIEHSKRTRTGYPAKRVLEVHLELITPNDCDIKTLYNKLRCAVFSKRGSGPLVFEPSLAPGCFINENRTEGPTGHGLPDILSMRFVVDLVYNDKGFY